MAQKILSASCDTDHGRRRNSSDAIQHTASASDTTNRRCIAWRVLFMDCGQRLGRFRQGVNFQCFDWFKINLEESLIRTTAFCVYLIQNGITPNTSQQTRTVKMNLNTLTELLPSLASSGMNVGLLGQPGVGKTEFVKAWADTLKANQIRPELAEPGDENKPVRFISISVSTKESVDVSGLMQVEDGVTKWAPPEWVPRGNTPAVVFLDEFAQADWATQNAFIKLIDRELDGADVSPRALFVIASNRASDNAGANEMPMHIRNRFAWFTVDTCVDTWKQWAEKNGVMKVVIDFIAYRPTMLNQFDPKSKENAYATPRSITRFSKVIENAPQIHWMTMAAAICGPTWAAEFEQFRKLQANLPSIDAVIAAPSTHALPADFGVLNALSTAIVRAAAKDKTKVDAVLILIERIYNQGNGEVAAKTMRDLAKAVPAVQVNPKADPLFNRLGHLLAG